MKRKLFAPSKVKPDTRYVSARKNGNGTARLYWKRKGQKAVRLPNGPEWMMAANRLNREYDGQRKAEIVTENSVAWAIRIYRESDGYKDLSPTSRGIYERWLKEYDKKFGYLHCKGISRKVVMKLARSIKRRPTRITAMAVMKNILNIAYDEDVIEFNPASEMKLKKNPPRQAIWQQPDMEKWLTAATKHAHAIAARRYFCLLRYTGQRPIDCVKMTKVHFNGDTIKVRQQKTGKLVEIPTHGDLKAELATDHFPNSLFLLAQPSGKPFGRSHMGVVFREICTKAGLGSLQARDLRRTAIVALGEAGCTDVEISAISGHDLDETKRILETYLPRTLVMARNAMAKWENKTGKESNALDKSDG